MPKSIQERVRATLAREERARDARERFANRAQNAAAEKLARRDADHDTGFTLYCEGATIPARASAAMREGYRDAMRAEDRELMGE